MGFSTLTEGIQFKKTATSFNIKSAIVAHQEKSTKALFDMCKLYYDRLPDEMKPSIRKSNAYELVFDSKYGTGLNSNIVCYTAGGKGIGRSETIHNLHVSEYAWWPDNKKDIIAGLMQAVPNHPDTLVVIESTANGFDDFKDRWERAIEGKSDFVPLFVAWYESDEYRMPVPQGFELMPAGDYGDEITVAQLYNLSDEQMVWRRWCIDNNCDGDLNMFHQEYPCSPEEAFISTGSSVFDQEKIIEQLERARKLPKPRVGTFTYDVTYKGPEIIISNIQFRNDKYGIITIYEEPKVKTDQNGNIIGTAPYVIGGDTAGVGKDRFTAKVINNITRRTAAKLKKVMMDEDLYAEQIYCLGKYYHYALVAIETNFSTEPIRHLERLGYTNQYERERMDTTTNKIQKAVGFETNSRTKPVIIAELVKLMREDPTLECDIDTLKEMLIFIRDDRGRYHCTEGSENYDDHVMATAIGHFASSQQSSTWLEIKTESTTFVQRNFKVKPKKQNLKGWAPRW